MAEDIIPLFSVSSSLKQGGIFTVEKAGTAKESGRTKGPISLCDLAKDEGLKKLYLVASNFAEFMPAYKNLAKIGCDLAFGLKIVICEDMAIKDEASFKTESKVIIFMKSDKAYHALINLYTKAATDGFYYVPRLDWKTLKFMWNYDLILSLPFYSSFLAKNTLTFSTITPELPCKPELLIERGQELPFDGLLEDAVNRYGKVNGIATQSCKSIYYKDRKDAKSFLIWRAILSRGATYDMPRMDHMCSREFCYEAWKELVK